MPTSSRARQRGLESDIDEGDIHHCINTAFLVGGVDMERWLAFRRAEPGGLRRSSWRSAATSSNSSRSRSSSWRNDVALFMGPRLSGYSAVDVEDLTAVELRSRQLTVGHVEVYRAAAPGFANAFLMLGAPQIGVRHSRRLAGLNKVTRQQWDTGQVWDDEIGVSTSLSPKFANISVPYGALIPPSSTTSSAPAGTSPATPARTPSCARSRSAGSRARPRASPPRWRPDRASAPRDVDAAAVQRELLRQGAYLSPAVERSLRPAPAAE